MSDEEAPITEIPPTPHVSHGCTYFTELRDAVGKWSVHNFGDQPSWRPAMGMVEEITELYEARDIGHIEKIFDAIGDIIIYMADYYFRRGWDFGEAWESRECEDWSQRTLVILAGSLCHSHLKGEQGIRGGAFQNAAKMHRTCRQVIGCLDRICTNDMKRELYLVVQSVWETVSKRDWKKNPNNAHEVAEGKS